MCNRGDFVIYRKISFCFSRFDIRIITRIWRFERCSLQGLVMVLSRRTGYHSWHPHKGRCPTPCRNRNARSSEVKSLEKTNQIPGENRKNDNENKDPHFLDSHRFTSIKIPFSWQTSAISFNARSIALSLPRSVPMKMCLFCTSSEYLSEFIFFTIL